MTLFSRLTWLLTLIGLAIILTYLTTAFQHKYYDTGNTSIQKNTTEELESRLVFERYHVESVYEGLPASIKFESHPEAKIYTTKMSEALSKGVNFAGQYTIAQWGCGTSCQGLAIIETKTGDIKVYSLVSETGVVFQKDSTLLIVNPPTDMPPERYDGRQIATDYYEMKNGELFLIAKKIEGAFVSNCTQKEVVAEQSVTGKRAVFSSPCTMPFGWFEVTL